MTITQTSPCPLDPSANNPERWQPDGGKGKKRSHWMMKNIALAFQLHDDIRVIYALAHTKDRAFYESLKLLKIRIDHRLQEMEAGGALKEPI